MAKITTFQAGFCTHKACMAVRGTGWQTCEFPAQTFLIEVNQHYWLWDTGYAQHFYDATKTGVFALYPKVTPVYFEAKDAIVSQLKQLGITPNDLQAVILSHFHGDHIAGLKDFPNTPFICSGQGWHKTRKLKGVFALSKGFVPNLIPSQFEDNVSFIESFTKAQLPAELVSLGDAYAVPNSQGQILLVNLPGHAAGHIGALIQTDEGWVLLAGDAAWSKKNYRELRLPATVANLIVDSRKDFYTTMNVLHELDKQNLKIILSHEVDRN